MELPTSTQVSSADCFCTASGNSSTLKPNYVTKAIGRIKPNINIKNPNKEQSPSTLKQHIVLNVALSQDSKQSDQSIKLDKCVKSKEGDKKRRTP